MCVCTLTGTRKTAQRPRQVGVCLKHLPRREEVEDARFHHENVPWQRVVNAKGGISPRWVSCFFPPRFGFRVGAGRRDGLEG